MGKGAIIFEDQCLVDPDVGFFFFIKTPLLFFYLSQIGHVVTYVISRYHCLLAS